MSRRYFYLTRRAFCLAIAAGVPTAATDGTITMVMHQVNQDGAGPFTCEVRTLFNTTRTTFSSLIRLPPSFFFLPQIDPAGTGETFESMQVTTDVPGKDLPSKNTLAFKSLLVHHSTLKLKLFSIPPSHRFKI